ELVPSLGHLVSPRCKRFDGIPDQALGLERRPDAIQATVKSNNFAKSLAEIQFYLFHVRKIAQIDDPPLGRQVPYQTRLGDKEAVSTTREEFLKVSLDVPLFDAHWDAAAFREQREFLIQYSNFAFIERSDQPQGAI